MERHLLIIGASVRAAAFSALRAGTQPWCADLFADVDLARACPAVRLPARDYPGRFLQLLEEAPPGPVMYTGALENYPTLIRSLMQARPLWGNGPDVVRQVRRPWGVAATLQKACIACPRAHRGWREDVRHGQWLIKPLAGGGGKGIRFWCGDAADSYAARRGCFFQQWIDGEPCAAVYVADGRQAIFLGATRQLMGESWLHAGPFQYCGSIGPLSLEPAVRATLVRLGDVLVNGFGLRGLFGVDFVLRGEVPYPVEINPRYTASMEVLEYATGLKAMDLHRQAFSWREFAPIPALQRGESGKQIVAKAILFACKQVIVPSNGLWMNSLSQAIGTFPEFADIPHAGEAIEQGHPVITLLERGEDLAVCLDGLKQRARTLDRLLFGR